MKAGVSGCRQVLANGNYTVAVNLAPRDTGYIRIYSIRLLHARLAIAKVYYLSSVGKVVCS